MEVIGNTSWFEVKVKYKKVCEYGNYKQVTDTYLIDAFSFSEAEERLIEEVTPYIKDEFDVCACAKRKYNQVMLSPANADADKFYKIKVNYITYNEKTNVEKKVTEIVVVQAEDLKQALLIFEGDANGTLMEYEIDSITNLNYVDVCKYKSGGVKKSEKSDVKETGSDAPTSENTSDSFSCSENEQNNPIVDGMQDKHKKKPS